MNKAWVLATLLGCLGMACEEKRLEPRAPEELKTDKLSGESQDAEGRDETITPPSPITGAYLTASVMEEKTINALSEVKVGIELYYKGQKVASDPSRYTVSLSITPGRDPAVSVNSAPSDVNGYDEIVTMTGPSVAQIRKAYKWVGVYLTIVDRSDYSSDTINTYLASAITNQDPASSTSVSTSTSSSTAGTATPGTGGTATPGTGVNGSNGASGAP